MKARSSIRSRITITMTSLAFFVSLVFSSFSFILLYDMEDGFFAWQMEEEIQYLTRQYEAKQIPLQSSKSYMVVYGADEPLPAEIKNQLHEHRNQAEISGLEGRHYHVRALNLPGYSYLVAEVSQQLFVRPAVSGFSIFLLLLAIIVSLIAMYLAYAVSRSTILPLERLAEEFDSATAENLPSHFADEYPANEIGTLAQTLESMLARTQKFLDRERNFTRDASHELRTPVAVTRGAVELLLLDSSVTGKPREQIKRIEQAVLEMNQTIEALLSLAREESADEGQSLVSLLPLIEQIVVDQSSKLDDRSVELDIQLSPSDTVACPEPVLRILLQNLLGNAFQYTEAGWIRIGFREGLLSVSNAVAPGTSNIHHQPPQGTGLGLSIVQRLCDRHGVIASVENQETELVATLEFPR